jgi:hypothetical protein
MTTGNERERERDVSEEMRAWHLETVRVGNDGRETDDRGWTKLRVTSGR